MQMLKTLKDWETYTIKILHVKSNGKEEEHKIKFGNTVIYFQLRKSAIEDIKQFEEIAYKAKNVFNTLKNIECGAKDLIRKIINNEKLTKKLQFQCDEIGEMQCKISLWIAELIGRMDYIKWKFNLTEEELK